MNNIGILDPNGVNLNPLTKTNYSDKYKLLAEKWKVLPAYKKIDQILNVLEKNQVTLVISSTGSGKTVLVPKALLHIFNYEKKIAVTLPKQIIAKSAAEYGAETLDVEVGTYVGYQYKGSDKKSKSDITKLLYATDGTIVARLLKDPTLSEYSGICIDEAHEMKVQISFLLYLLKQTIKLRADFKLVIMSATIDENIFRKYFKEYKFDVINIGGERTFPIKSIWLDKPINQNDYIKCGTDIINKLIREKTTGKTQDILFFVTSINDTIETCKKYEENTTDMCIEVYAGMNQEKQDLLQKSDLGKRKIVIATNVAESSLTIRGIKYVIDSGLELFSYYNPKHRAKVLEKKLITQAQAIQRMGRTGRTESGTCYHLYTQNDFENKMDKFPEPAIRVSNISGECLRLLNLPTVKTIYQLRQILSEFIEPPKEEYIQDAINYTIQMGLLTDNTINKLGSLISDMQLDPTQGLSIYVAYHLNCIREVIAVIAIIDAMKTHMTDLYIKPDKETASKKIIEKYENARHTMADKHGDHITLLKIFLKYTKFLQTNKDPSEWIYKNFLKITTLNKARQYYKKILDMARQLIFGTNKIAIDNVFDYTLEERIVASIAFGYKLNRGFLSEGKNKVGYNTDRVQNVAISKDSFMWMKGRESKEVIYHELFTMSGKTEMIIVTTITNKIKELIKIIENHI